MTGISRQNRICQSFNHAEAYDEAASMQRYVARQLFERIKTAQAQHQPARILELGCGTGFLTTLLAAHWPDAEIIATDFAPQMVQRMQARLGERVTGHVMDAAAPDVEGSFDIICGSLVFQWLDNPQAVLLHLEKMLKPGGRLFFSTLTQGTFEEWQQACTSEHSVGTPDYPTLAALQSCRPALCAGSWEGACYIQPFNSARAFLHHLSQTGACVPVAGYKPLQPAALRQAMNRFEAGGCAISWHIAYGCFQRPVRAGVFVTGTDTGVGKTFISACLVKAWSALYWKPLQSGLADEPGDTLTVTELAGADAASCLPSVGAFQASLSPEAAARAEGAEIDPASLVLPLAENDRPLVVEGAGGLMVPVTDRLMICDLIVRWALPVVVVARSGLGTLNHTLLTLEALRNRGVAIAGVVLNGPPDEDNCRVIEEKGRVRILAQVPHQSVVSAETVAEASRKLPSWSDVSPF